MRLHSAASEETLRTRKFLADWAGEGFISKAQYQILEGETVSDLRSTNIFLRLVMFLFTQIIVVAVVALFLQVFLSRPSEQVTGVFLLIFSAICYAVAEAAVSRGRLHHYGIEEALAVCSVGLFCAGMWTALFSSAVYSSKPDRAECLVLAGGAAFSLWIWRRFGLWYAFPAAMIFVVFLPGYWTTSHSAQHLIVVAFYTVGLMCVARARLRHRFDYVEAAYSLAEALLWLGIYMAINLQLSSLNLSAQWWNGTSAAAEFARPFYWITWVLIWCLPPVVLARGIRQKDRFVIEAGAIIAILTLVTNKPYLGWPRHTWDPMFLGISLAGVGFFIRRWLARGPNGIRGGFTAARVLGKDQNWINTGATVLGALSPHAVTPSGQTGGSGFGFGGGQSGGGGAGGQF